MIIFLSLDYNKEKIFEPCWCQVRPARGPGPRAGEHCGAQWPSETCHTFHPEGSQLYQGSRRTPPSQESQGESYIRRFQWYCWELRRYFQWHQSNRVQLQPRCTFGNQWKSDNSWIPWRYKILSKSRGDGETSLPEHSWLKQFWYFKQNVIFLMENYFSMRRLRLQLWRGWRSRMSE